MEKICTKCNKLKDLTCFIREKRRISGYGPVCKTCNSLKINSLDKKFYRSFYDSKRRVKERPTYKKLEHTLNWDQWQILKPQFAEQYNIWVKSGFTKKFAPTIDRIDNSIGYIPGNVQVIAYGENTTKDQKGEDNHRVKLKHYDILAIKALKETNPALTYAKLGTIFNISSSHAYSIIKNKCWRHLDYMDLLSGE